MHIELYDLYINLFGIIIFLWPLIIEQIHAFILKWETNNEFTENNYKQLKFIFYETKLDRSPSFKVQGLNKC